MISPAYRNETVNERIFAYCERGTSPAFWAEPWNAVSNAGFLLAAAIAAYVFKRRARSLTAPKASLTEWTLIALVASIGVGSFLFHTLATRWAAVADTAPIALFMLAYTAYALRRYVGLSLVACAAGVAFFIALLAAAFASPCPMELRGIVRGGACLNGSVGYLPALLMLIAIGGVASVRGQAAGQYLLAAAVVFAASLVARTLDHELCGPIFTIAGRPRGTHAAWHLLNALTLGLLLLAAVRHGSKPPHR